MKPRRLFRTRVASRILTLFFVGAIVPVVVLQILSFRAVSDLLERQTEDRLAQLADASVQIILERLASSASWVASAGDLLVVGDGTSRTVDRLAHSISGLAVTAGGEIRASAGDVGSLPELDPAEEARLAGGQRLLKEGQQPNGAAGDPRLHLVIPQEGEEGALLWARLHADSIWASAMVLGAGPRVAEMCILDAELRSFACKTGPGSDLPAKIRAANPTALEGMTRFHRDGEEYLAAWKRVYLRSAYGVPEWIVAVAESEASVHAPVARFTYNLPLALAVGVGLVLLLANFLVTRTMGPLEELTRGTQRIAGHDLSARVEVESDDEFGVLASSFNTMARRLRLQFDQIEAAHAVDRAVIEDNDAAEAIRALGDGLGRLSSGVRSAVVFVETTLEDTAGLYRVDGSSPAGRRELSREDLRALHDVVGEGGHASLRGRAVPECLHGAGLGLGGGDVLLVQMSVQGSLVGFVAMEFPPEATPADDEISRARRLIGQAGVALNEHRLRGELVEFGDETLRALANAIDAKSRWTTGHSERVTALAGAIGRKLGLTGGDLDTLRRGGLLHDVGKIGVSTAILDHPGRLDETQRRAVEAHTVIGHRILEPIRVFRPMLPIVLHHHERWDGRGYPHGLEGEAIPYLARVLAVADVFDALASPRPYRGALAMDVVVGHVRSESAGAFDPRIVEAFDAVLADGWVHEIPEDEPFTHDI